MLFGPYGPTSSQKDTFDEWTMKSFLKVFTAFAIEGEEREFCFAQEGTYQEIAFCDSERLGNKNKFCY